MAEYIPNFNNVNGKAIFQESATRTNLTSGENIAVSFGKIKKWFSDLGTAAFDDITSTYSPSGTAPVNGTAITDALDPISETEYSQLVTKDRPLYFIYED